MTDDIDIEAAEYVLGTLDGVERAAFAERLSTDAAATRSVAAWEARVAGLDGFLAPVIPSPEVWARIERLLQTSSAQTSSAKAQPFRLIEGGGFLAAPKLQVSRNRWRAAALLSGSIAAAPLVFVGYRETIGFGQDTSGATYVAAVNRGGDKPALLVRVDLKTHQIFVRPVSAEAPAGRSLELWYIGDNKPPRSMGLVDKTALTMPIPQGADDTAATFAVSVEPPGGSKTGGPTGPVVYAGQLIKE